MIRFIPTGSRLGSAQPTRRAVVFLDRDGVLVEDVHYLRRVAQVRLLPGVAQALRMLAAHFWLIVVTNQSGLARGYLTEAELAAIHQALLAQLQAEGATLDAIYACPHLPDGTVSTYRMACTCRKPAPGMLLRACQDWAISAEDINQAKLALARQMGATHTLLATEEPLAAIQQLCPDGVDFAIEATGRPAVMLQALAAVRQQGGTAVIVGNARSGEMLTLDPRQLNQGKRLLGTWGGDNWPDRDYLRYGMLLQHGRLNLQPLLDKTYSLAAINEALDDLEAGRTARPLIDLQRA